MGGGGGGGGTCPECPPPPLPPGSAAGLAAMLLRCTRDNIYYLWLHLSVRISEAAKFVLRLANCRDNASFSQLTAQQRVGISVVGTSAWSGPTGFTGFVRQPVAQGHVQQSVGSALSGPAVLCRGSPFPASISERHQPIPCEFQYH